ncbi:sugar ABC transporter ATP-binding protein [Hydrogenoanaerobacterium sp.]|uniref:sugar ABC transporter ATP-binding protein n=1 Tax=Hydrogenoanaerobacterium sp. TaxID=2953763 RepID=UPI00289A6C25|nr:sugar ABC transporter ATP-binding protein [Hydrogenoanaerobacterium sp.]
MEQYLVELSGITKSFPGVKALKGVSLTLKPGEVVALLGENGAGKSTLMKILSGVYTKDEGTIKVKGQEVTISGPKEAERLGIAIIHQELNLCKHLTVAENIFLTREETKMGILNDRVINKKAKELLDSLNLDLKPTTKVGTLPVSKQQMVEICKALSVNADIIIMDEPTSALTEKEIEDLFVIIRKLKEQGKGIVYISHRLEELKHIVDRVTIMRDGDYITTLNFADTNLEQIIGYMVGREIKDKFPRVECPVGDVVFEVKNLSAPSGVKDVSFEARKGEIIAFAGLMGAGRTELARVLFGADKKTSGQVFINGKEVQIKSPRDAIAAGLYLAPEDRKKDGLCIKMTVAENISLPNMDKVTKNGITRIGEEKALAERIRESLKIKTPSIHQQVKNLSGGNQQKIVVGKWLVKDANVIIFDEPTRGIDVAAKVEIYNIMNELKQAGVCVIYVSSELPEVLGLSDRVLVMCNGRLKANLETKKTNQEEILHYATQYDVMEDVK